MTKGPKVMSEEIVNRVRALADPILSSEGMDLVEIQYRREANGWVVRLTIDKEGGVTLDDCSRVNQEVGRILDVEDFIPTRYHLEISSPGLDRALKNEKDFLKYRNRLIKVKTLDPIDKRRQFKGRLLGLVENHIQMEIDGGIIRIPLSNVSKANLEIEF
jgi:ribosome maturation factor RimP